MEVVLERLDRLHFLNSGASRTFDCLIEVVKPFWFRVDLGDELFYDGFVRHGDDTFEMSWASKMCVSVRVQI